MSVNHAVASPIDTRYGVGVVGAALEWLGMRSAQDLAAERATAATGQLVRLSLLALGSIPCPVRRFAR